MPDLAAQHHTFSALLRSRRTVKPQDMDPSREVPRDLVLRVLEDATWAPTHGLTEPWRFRVYEGDQRARLAAALQKAYVEVTPADEFREDKMTKMGLNPLLAPVIVVAWMKRSAGDKIPELEEIEAVACALQNTMLSATAAGLGSFWSSPPLLDSVAFKQWLGIGAADRCLALLYLGWPRDDAPLPKRVRKSVLECVSWA